MLFLRLDLGDVHTYGIGPYVFQLKNLMRNAKNFPLFPTFFVLFISPTSQTQWRGFHAKSFVLTYVLGIFKVNILLCALSTLMRIARLIVESRSIEQVSNQSKSKCQSSDKF